MLKISKSIKLARLKKDKVEIVGNNKDEFDNRDKVDSKNVLNNNCKIVNLVKDKTTSWLRRHA